MQHIIAPAYIYPTLAGWTTEKNGYPTVSIMIANPASGPGVSANSDYTTAINAARAAGIKILGYVHTSYGARSLGTVEGEIDSWYSFYTIDGVFIDEVIADTAHLSYYTSIYTYIKGKDGVRNYVLLNPGTVPSDHGFTSIADTICLFEESYTGWQTDWSNVSSASWLTSSPATRWYAIVHDIPNTAALYEVILAAKNASIGYVFVTDQSEPNPYGAAPASPLWSTELAYVTALPTRVIGAMLASPVAHINITLSEVY